jgi:hypothetical protein
MQKVQVCLTIIICGTSIICSKGDGGEDFYVDWQYSSTMILQDMLRKVPYAVSMSSGHGATA